MLATSWLCVTEDSNWRKRQIRFHLRSFFLLLLLKSSMTTTFAFTIRKQLIRSQLQFYSGWPQKHPSYASSAQPIVQTNNFDGTRSDAFVELFDLEVPEGRCLAISYDNLAPILQDTSATTTANHWLYAHLHPDEVAYAFNMQGASSSYQQSFILGRMAMRTLIGLNVDDCPILKDEHGRPTLPSGYLGSISHKKTTAVALVARRDNSKLDVGIGVDLEYATGNKASIAKRVLTKDEIRSLGQVEVSAFGTFTLARVTCLFAQLTPPCRLYRAFLPLKKSCYDSP
ncbi:hypothetical protein MPSEU_000213300 [Mayamaea pseudoterrestris]|nr:hypothetical protein MPSEU_000213300 [Mayamaea pseudoterrestris]